MNLQSLCIVATVLSVLSFNSVSAQAQNPACPQEVAGTHGAKLLGADTYTSDIVINACVALGGNAQRLINSRQDGVCTITSGYRSPQHNAQVGGANASQHVQGRAIDVVVQGQTLRFGQLLLAGLCCKNRCVGGLGYYNRNLFHVDNRQSVMAWGPGYTTSGIAQIQDPQMRNLLTTYLRNGASAQIIPGSQPSGEPISNQQQGLVYAGTTGVQEDGTWATTGQYTQQQNTIQQQQGVPQQQQVYQSTPYTTQYYEQPTTLPTVVSSGTTTTGAQQVSNPPDEIVEDEVAPASAKPYVLCTENNAGTRVTVEWSCGSALGKKVWAEGRGFNARRSPIGTVQLKKPSRTTPYSIDCFSSGKIVARASCIVKVPKKANSGSESFRVTGESEPQTGSWCIFKTCLW